MIKKINKNQIGLSTEKKQRRWEREVRRKRERRNKVGDWIGDLQNLYTEEENLRELPLVGERGRGKYGH